MPVQFRTPLGAWVILAIWTGGAAAKPPDAMSVLAALSARSDAAAAAAPQVAAPPALASAKTTPAPVPQLTTDFGDTSAPRTLPVDAHARLLSYSGFQSFKPGSKFEEDAAPPLPPEPPAAQRRVAPKPTEPAPKAPPAPEPAPATPTVTKPQAPAAAPALKPPPAAPAEKRAAKPEIPAERPRAEPREPAGQAFIESQPKPEPARPPVVEPPRPLEDLPVLQQPCLLPAQPSAPAYTPPPPPPAATVNAGNTCPQSQPCVESDRGLLLGGWIDQGVTLNRDRPLDRYNGPVLFNDRDRDYQLNQVDLFAAKTVSADNDFDLGGRIDALYGTDGRFPQALGLETDWHQAELNQVAVPQFYLDAAVKEWLVRIGRFYSPFGLEGVAAPDNFFYSHSYTFIYGEPITLTGVQLTRNVADDLSVNGGLHQGWDTFRSVPGHDHASAFGGFKWHDPSNGLAVDFEVTAGPENPGNTTVMYSLVGKWQASPRLKYVIQHDYGQSSGGNPQPPAGPAVATAEWYGIDQYWFYEWNEVWTAGLRFEWFRDNNGVRVRGLGTGNAAAAGGFMGDFYELSAGLNWKPFYDFTVRPELRWDWFCPDNAAVPHPFGAATRNDQFLAAVDVIITF